jgi:hypothetical protein
MFVGVESFNRQTLLAAAKGQNRPEMYRDIVRLCREHGISSHFSNIIGFPQDTEQEVLHHLEMLHAVGPTVASFYILCPIPGTEQYDDFLARGLIDENNLDRFDGTCLTWRHPCLSRSQVAGLLFRCYRRFFSWGRVLRNAVHRTFGSRRVLAESAKNFGLSLFSRYCAWRRMHPMSGGVRQVRRDGVQDLIALRKEMFGFELAPLPPSLQLSAAERRLNGVPGPRMRASRPQAADPLPASQFELPISREPHEVGR